MDWCFGPVSHIWLVPDFVLARLGLGLQLVAGLTLLIDIWGEEAIEEWSKRIQARLSRRDILGAVRRFGIIVGEPVVKATRIPLPRAMGSGEDQGPVDSAEEQDLPGTGNRALAWIGLMISLVSTGAFAWLMTVRDGVGSDRACGQGYRAQGENVSSTGTSVRARIGFLVSLASTGAFAWRIGARSALRRDQDKGQVNGANEETTPGVGDPLLAWLGWLFALVGGLVFAWLVTARGAAATGASLFAGTSIATFVISLLFVGMPGCFAALVLVFYALELVFLVLEGILEIATALMLGFLRRRPFANTWLRISLGLFIIGMLLEGLAS